MKMFFFFYFINLFIIHIFLTNFISVPDPGHQDLRGSRGGAAPRGWLSLWGGGAHRAPGQRG